MWRATVLGKKEPWKKRWWKKKKARIQGGRSN